MYHVHGSQPESVSETAAIRGAPEQLSTTRSRFLVEEGRSLRAFAGDFVEVSLLAGGQAHRVWVNTNRRQHFTDPTELHSEIPRLAIVGDRDHRQRGVFSVKKIVEGHYPRIAVVQ